MSTLILNSRSGIQAKRGKDITEAAKEGREAFEKEDLSAPKAFGAQAGRDMALKSVES